MVSRVDADEVFPGFYLGALSAAIDTEWVRERNITTIINVCCARYVPPPSVIYMNVPLRDGNEKDLAPAFEKVYPLMRLVAVKREYLESKREEERNPLPPSLPLPSCLIHCQHGKSRSAAILLMFMMRWYREPLFHAYRQVVLKREIMAPPIFLFQLQLTAFERAEFDVDYNSVDDWAGSTAKAGERPKRRRAAVNYCDE